MRTLFFWCLNLAGDSLIRPFLQTGVDVMYLQPITRAYSNHKYDTSDYNEMDAAWFEKRKTHGSNVKYSVG